MSGADGVLFEWMKWPDTPYRTTPMVRLGEDDKGTWFFAPRGAAATYAAHGAAPLPVSFLTLLPAGEQWWIATWMRGNDEIDIDLYVDIVKPPTWDGDACLRIVDLDLDVIRRTNGHVFIDDEDEFERHTVELGYPSDVVSGARTTADDVLAAVTEARPPFAQPPEHWLATSRTVTDATG